MASKTLNPFTLTNDNDADQKQEQQNDFSPTALVFDLGANRGLFYRSLALD